MKTIEQIILCTVQWRKKSKLCKELHSNFRETNVKENRSKYSALYTLFNTAHLPPLGVSGCRVLKPSAGILEQSKGAKNRVGIGLLYRPARLHMVAESIPSSWIRFLRSLNVYKFGFKAAANLPMHLDDVTGRLDRSGCKH